MPQDETTFAQFYARQVNTVYRICYVRLKNQMDAEDVTQEVFLRAMQQPQQQDKSGKKEQETWEKEVEEALADK